EAQLGEGGVAGDLEDLGEGAAAALAPEVLQYLPAALWQRQLGELGEHGLGGGDPVLKSRRRGDDLERGAREVALAVGAGEERMAGIGHEPGPRVADRLLVVGGEG